MLRHKIPPLCLNYGTPQDWLACHLASLGHDMIGTNFYLTE